MDRARELLVDVPGTWPVLEVRHTAPQGARPTLDRVGSRSAELTQHHGWLEVAREPAVVTFRLPARPADAELVHPYLAPAAALAARWAGRESFHAGAVIGEGGGAWAVLGDKESGKSTTLAWLALNGHPVLADDLLVVDGDTALAGPRCLDLRESSAKGLNAGRPLGVVGARERWRLPLDAVDPSVPLRGWVLLAWGDEVAVERLRGPERMLALLPFRSVQLPPEAPDRLIDLSSLPVLRLRRPRRWDSLPAAGERLAAAIAG